MKNLNKNQNTTFSKEQYDEQLQECLEELEQLVEDFTGVPHRRNELKHRKWQYLGRDINDELTRSELKELRSISNKLKKSSKKEERDKEIQLGKQVSFTFNTRGK
jgi:tRNA C32,U32 (ribose-2'-O)-methylase TrmJ